MIQMQRSTTTQAARKQNCVSARGWAPLHVDSLHYLGNNDAMTCSPCTLLRFERPTAGCAMDGRPAYVNCNNTEHSVGGQAHSGRACAQDKHERGMRTWTGLPLALS